MSDLVAGNHNDLFNIEMSFEDITKQVTKAEIPLVRLFINVDAGFD
ncbi:hypothetical protein MODO_3173 [Myroides odoratimimus]|nr:hypothetical protein [Myroides odoratimimus]GAQ15477.1 hypothetical protein MODO_3173 [Myroides odoratimimus]